jgi:hypothetical protein
MHLSSPPYVQNAAPFFTSNMCPKSVLQSTCTSSFSPCKLFYEGKLDKKKGGKVNVITAAAVESNPAWSVKRSGFNFQLI